MSRIDRPLATALCALALFAVPAFGRPASAAEGLAAAAADPSPGTKLLRFPDVHGDRVVFTWAGDLWTASAGGGAPATATRLTAHPGVELFAKFSPDGRTIAFTGQYDGDEQVYVMPAVGGEPLQLTFYPAQGPLTPRWGYDNQVHGWTPDGTAVVFRSLRDGFDLTDSRLYTVALTGGLGEPLPMPVSGAGEISADGRQVAYTPLVRDFRTWKRYQGGWATDVWIFDLASHDAVNISKHPRSDRDPMWIDGQVWFASDRDGKLNLYRYDPATKATTQVTRHRDGDVRWPSRGDAGQIVYELNGSLRLLETASGATRELVITVPSDVLARRPARVPAHDQIEDFDVSPRGERALFVARGDVFTAPVEKGAVRNLTASSRWHDKAARWSPDGKWIAFLSDRTGEEELYLAAQDGSGEPRQLTRGSQAFRYAPVWSSDSKRLAFGDQDGKVWVVTVAGDSSNSGQEPQQVADDRAGQTTDYTWAPGGNFLALSLSNPNSFRSVHIWSAADGKLRRVTSEMINAYEPVWSPKGDYLYYLADRELSPLISAFEWNYAVNRETGVFALALRRDVPHPFPPESDEVELDKAKAEKKDEKAEKEEKEKEKEKAAKEKGNGNGNGDDDEPAGDGKVLKRIDWEGLAERVATVPVKADNYQGLTAADGGLLVIRSAPFFYGRERPSPPALVFFSLEKRKEAVIAEGVNGYALSANGKKVLTRQGGVYILHDVKLDGRDQKTVSTSGLAVDRVPAEEWAEIFDEVWRRYRDFFYVPNMHGYDWAALREQYRPLLAHVGHRSDLNYVLGEMIAELNVSHAYVEGGDFEVPRRPPVALPGARFELDEKSGRYRISEIIRGENDEERYRAPLTEIGVEARVGDYVLAIDGVALEARDNPYRLLRYKADRPVELTLNDRPSEASARKVTFRPIASEDNLLYDQWVRKNRERVDRLSGGRLGYLHIPDMGGDGLREFIKWFYPQVRKEGMVVDARGNGGGNVSQMLLERLARTLLSVGFSRHNEFAETYPNVTFTGPMVCLINETTASDGDIFAAMFKQAGLGPVIGKRSWGGVVGITDHGPLIDGGSVYVPEGASASAATGEWIIEGHGVDPDIEVENDPKSLIAGLDPQLERAVAEAMKALERTPSGLPPRPADPIKTE